MDGKNGGFNILKTECIELELEKYYRQGYAEGIEAGRVIAVTMCEEVFKSRTCSNCGWYDEEGDCNRDGMLIVPKIINYSSYGLWEKTDDK